jgi:hypothetical protein
MELNGERRERHTQKKQTRPGQGDTKDLQKIQKKKEKVEKGDYVIKTKSKGRPFSIVPTGSSSPPSFPIILHSDPTWYADTDKKLEQHRNYTRI